MLIEAWDAFEISVTFRPSYLRILLVFSLQCLYVLKPQLRPLTQAELGAGVQKAEGFMAGT